jgi:trans-2-enoyl-CoA reductase
MLRTIDGNTLVSVNKALVTRASAVIPGIPLYIALLYTVMREKNLHEGCIEQMNRLLREHLYGGSPLRTDRKGRIRLDDLEMRGDVQEEVSRLWEEIGGRIRGGAKGAQELPRAKTPRAEMLRARTPRVVPPRGLFQVFREEFLRHHGFCMESVDYDRDVEV